MHLHEQHRLHVAAALGRADGGEGDLLGAEAQQLVGPIGHPLGGPAELQGKGPVQPPRPLEPLQEAVAEGLDVAVLGDELVVVLGFSLGVRPVDADQGPELAGLGPKGLQVGVEAGLLPGLAQKGAGEGRADSSQEDPLHLRHQDHRLQRRRVLRLLDRGRPGRTGDGQEKEKKNREQRLLADQTGHNPTPWISLQGRAKWPAPACLEKHPGHGEGFFPARVSWTRREAARARRAEKKKILNPLP